MNPQILSSPQIKGNATPDPPLDEEYAVAGCEDANGRKPPDKKRAR